MNLNSRDVQSKASLNLQVWSAESPAICRDADHPQQDEVIRSINIVAIPILPGSNLPLGQHIGRTKGHIPCPDKGFVANLQRPEEKVRLHWAIRSLKPEADRCAPAQGLVDLPNHDESNQRADHARNHLSYGGVYSSRSRSLETGKTSRWSFGA